MAGSLQNQCVRSLEGATRRAPSAEVRAQRAERKRRRVFTGRLGFANLEMNRCFSVLELESEGVARAQLTGFVQVTLLHDRDFGVATERAAI